MSEYDVFEEAPLKGTCRYDPNLHGVPGSDAALTDSGDSAIRGEEIGSCIFSSVENGDLCPFHKPLDQKNGEIVSKLLRNLIEDMLEHPSSKDIQLSAPDAIRLVGTQLENLDLTTLDYVDDSSFHLDLNLRHTRIENELQLSDAREDEVTYSGSVFLDGSHIGGLCGKYVTVEEELTATYTEFTGVDEGANEGSDDCFNLLSGEAMSLNISQAEFNAPIQCSGFKARSIEAENIDCDNKVDLSEVNVNEINIRDLSGREANLMDITVSPNVIDFSDALTHTQGESNRPVLDADLRGIDCSESLLLTGATLPPSDVRLSGISVGGDMYLDEQFSISGGAEEPDYSTPQVSISNTTVDGELSFKRGKIQCGLDITDCDIGGEINFKRATLGPVDIDDISAHKIIANKMSADELIIEKSQIYDGIVVLADDEITSYPMIFKEGTRINRLEILFDGDSETSSDDESGILFGEFKVSDELHINDFSKADASELSGVEDDEEPEQHGISISDCVFAGQITASGIESSGLVFTDARFEGQVDISYTLHSDIHLEQCRFEDLFKTTECKTGDVELRDTRFGDRLDCSGLDVRGTMDVVSTRVAGIADFTGAAFDDHVAFQNVTLQDDCLFKGTPDTAPVFKNGLSVDRTRCRGKADFRVTESPDGQTAETPVFDESIIEGTFAAEQSNLTNGDFTGFSVETDTRDCHTSDNTKIVEDDGSPPISFTGTDLTDSTFRNADLRGANLENVKLRDTDLQKADLTDAKLGTSLLNGARITAETTFGIQSDSGSPVKISYDQKAREKPVSDTDEPSPEDSVETLLNKAENVYVQIETLARNNGRERLARDCFYRKKNVRQYRYRQLLSSEAPSESGWGRQLIWKMSKFVKLVLWSVFQIIFGGLNRAIPGQDRFNTDRPKPHTGSHVRKYWTAVCSEKVLGYGERYSNLAWTAAIVILLSGLVYPVLGMSTAAGQPVTYPVFGNVAGGWGAYILEWIDVAISGVILSLSQFIGVGEGGYTPTRLGELLAIAERSTGLISLGLLLFIIQRRTAR